jgi:hypothetical protein
MAGDGPAVGWQHALGCTAVRLLLLTAISVMAQWRLVNLKRIAFVIRVNRAHPLKSLAE